MGRLAADAVLTFVIGFDCSLATGFCNRFSAVEAVRPHLPLQHGLGSSDPVLCKDQRVLSFSVWVAYVSAHVVLRQLMRALSLIAVRLATSLTIVGY